jgi:hypothetical protein
MAWLVMQGKLAPVLPGIYAPPDSAYSIEVLMRAVSLRHPDAVVFGAAAAKASFWPEASVGTIEAAASTRLASRPGYTFSRRHIPAELVTERAGLRYTAPALTAIDLASFECADAIDIALRTRAATLTRMYEALRLTPNWTGSQERLRLLIDSRNEPWSAAERLAHRILRGARITAWKPNFPVSLCLWKAASISSTLHSRTSNSRLRSMAGFTKRMRTSSNRTDRGRTLWSPMAGGCCALPGGCSRSTPRLSWLRFCTHALRK